PGAAGGGEDDHRAAMLDGALEDARDLLAHHRAHRPAHEGEVEGADGDEAALDRAHPGDEGVLLVELLRRLARALAVLLRVREIERIERGKVPVHLLEAPLVEDELQPAARGKGTVVTARADVPGLLVIGARDDLPAAFALEPEAVHADGGIARLALGREDLGLLLAKPGHGAPPTTHRPPLSIMQRVNARTCAFWTILVGCDTRGDADARLVSPDVLCYDPRPIRSRDVDYLP